MKKTRKSRPGERTPGWKELEKRVVGSRGEAIFSDCERYRYMLRRTWRAEEPYVLFVGLNPSTADAEKDDPTVRRCIGFAKKWGFGGLFMGNIFAFRSTDPALLRQVTDPVGLGNDCWLRLLSSRAAITVAAWGIHGEHQGRGAKVQRLLQRVHCLGVTKGGYPLHPLYLPAKLRPIAWHES